jgi:hypothetical protein
MQRWRRWYVAPGGLAGCTEIPCGIEPSEARVSAAFLDGVRVYEKVKVAVHTIG